jgi:hypothetical protein
MSDFEGNSPISPIYSETSSDGGQYENEGYAEMELWFKYDIMESGTCAVCLEPLNGEPIKVCGTCYKWIHTSCREEMYKHFQFKCPYCRSWLFE